MWSHERFEDDGARAYDSADGDLTSRIQVMIPAQLRRAETAPALYHVHYTVQDRSGNQARVLRRVTVERYDWCEEDSPCHRHAKCTNDWDEAKCECLSGWEGNGRSCKDRMPPRIELRGSRKVEINQYDEWHDEGAEAWDEQDGERDVEVQGRVDTDTVSIAHWSAPRGFCERRAVFNPPPPPPPPPSLPLPP